MKTTRLILAVCRESAPWLAAAVATSALFMLFAWLAYPSTFPTLVGLMLLVSLLLIVAPLAWRFMLYRRALPLLATFALDPSEEHEAAVVSALPSFQRHLIPLLGERLRALRTELNYNSVELSEYETWIESWVHEIKTPLTLMRLVLDNRASEMSPQVRQRLSYAHITMMRDVEKILYFARLGAPHRDYVFEPIDLATLCETALDGSRASLEEAGVTVELAPSLATAPFVTSDRNGLLFILSQIISNTTKYATALQISVQHTAQEITLILSDNGPGVSPADAPFIFDKGFTGAGGSVGDNSANGGNALDRSRASAAAGSTGMGLYLAQRMAHDLALTLAVADGTSNAKGDNPDTATTGLTLTLTFASASSTPSSPPDDQAASWL